MNKHQKAALDILHGGNAPMYASRMAHARPFSDSYITQELVEDVLMPLVELGFVAQTKDGRSPQYQITSAGEIARHQYHVEPVATSVAGPMLIDKLAGKYEPPKWDTASTRGNHPDIKSLGVG